VLLRAAACHPAFQGGARLRALVLAFDLETLAAL
jgi:hypothetical protein